MKIMRKIFINIGFIISCLSYASEVKKYPILYNEWEEELFFQAYFNENVVEISKEEALGQIIFNLKDYTFYETGEASHSIVSFLSNNISIIEEDGFLFLYDYKKQQKREPVLAKLRGSMHLGGARQIKDDIYYFGSVFISTDEGLEGYPFVKKNNEFIYENYTLEEKGATVLSLNEELDVYIGVKVTAQEGLPLYWLNGEAKMIPLKSQYLGDLRIVGKTIIGSYIGNDDEYGHFFFDISTNNIETKQIKRECTYEKSISYDPHNHVIFGSCFGNNYLLHKELGYIFWEDLSKEFFKGQEASSAVLGVKKDGKSLIGYTQDYIWEIDLEKPLIEYLKKYRKQNKE